ncbi:MAG: hypothetical protein RBG13Loki_0579, partial [Promethearchaeota archaeon CR_4]
LILSDEARKDVRKSLAGEVAKKIETLDYFQSSIKLSSKDVPATRFP